MRGSPSSFADGVPLNVRVSELKCNQEGRPDAVYDKAAPESTLNE
jgi:hypothetical protein